MSIRAQCISAYATAHDCIYLYTTLHPQKEISYWENRLPRSLKFCIHHVYIFWFSMALLDGTLECFKVPNQSTDKCFSQWTTLMSLFSRWSLNLQAADCQRLYPLKNSFGRQQEVAKKNPHQKLWNASKSKHTLNAGCQERCKGHPDTPVAEHLLIPSLRMTLTRTHSPSFSHIQTDTHTFYRHRKRLSLPAESQRFTVTSSTHARSTH